MLWGDPDEVIRREIGEYQPKLASSHNLDNKYTKEEAIVDAEVGISLALRANTAHTAMQLGELVVTDDFAFTRPHAAKETFEALQIAASSYIGRDTLGAYAIEFLSKQTPTNE
jgi:hypothetical protein